MILLAVCFLFLAIIAFFPVFVVALGKYEGTFLQKLELLIGDNDSLILSLGTLALVSALALLTNHLSNVSAEKREKSAQRVQAELKIAEFRQEWIENFRDDLTRYGVLLFAKKSAEDERERLRLEMKLMVRLNQEERLAEELRSKMNSAGKYGKEGSFDEKKNAYRELTEAGNSFLRNEWKRLVSDIKQARLLDEEDVEHG